MEKWQSSKSAQKKNHDDEVEQVAHTSGKIHMMERDWERCLNLKEQQWPRNFQSSRRLIIESWQMRGQVALYVSEQ